MHREIILTLFGDGFFDHSFAVLRDPVERLKSEYRHRAKRAASLGKQIDDFDTWAPRVLKRSLRKPYLFDNHIRPQSEFVFPGMRLFRFEDGLEPVFDWIDELSGFSEPATREWKRNLSHVSVGMSPATERVIRNFYAKDEQLLSGTVFN